MVTGTTHSAPPQKNGGCQGNVAPGGTTLNPVEVLRDTKDHEQRRARITRSAANCPSGANTQRRLEASPPHN